MPHNCGRPATADKSTKNPQHLAGSGRNQEVGSCWKGSDGGGEALIAITTARLIEPQRVGYRTALKTQDVLVLAGEFSDSGSTVRDPDVNLG